MGVTINVEKTAMHSEQFTIAIKLDNTKFTAGEVLKAGTIIGGATPIYEDPTTVLGEKGNVAQTGIEAQGILVHDVVIKTDDAGTVTPVAVCFKGVAYSELLKEVNGSFVTDVDVNLKKHGITFYGALKKGVLS